MASRKRPISALEGADGEGGAAAEGVTLSVRDRVLGQLERAPDHTLSDSALQKAIPMCTAEEIAHELQGLMRDRRVEAYAVRAPFGAPKGSVSSEHTFKLVTAEKAARLKDLEENDLMVLQYIERGGTQGVWVRNIKITTRLQQVQINKILRKLETRKLIKPVKSVAFKNRRMYMLFELEPDKALTGGPWYTDHQLDEDFVNKLRE
jgi:DNA-directed RNA polymerase III subunit RPC6